MDKEILPPAYVPLLTYADRHKIGEWLCRLAWYHDQTASTLREGTEIIFNLNTTNDHPSSDTHSKYTSASAHSHTSSAPTEGRHQCKGKGRVPSRSPTPPPIATPSLLREPRTSDPSTISEIFGRMTEITSSSGSHTDVGPSRTRPREDPNALPAPAIKKTTTISVGQKRKAGAAPTKKVAKRSR